MCVMYVCVVVSVCVCVRQQDGELLRVLFRSRILYALRGAGYVGAAVWLCVYVFACV